MNPIDSIKEWVDGVGHSDKTSLYAGLVIEEMGELLEAIQTYRREFQYGIGAADSVSYSLKNFDVEYSQSNIQEYAKKILTDDKFIFIDSFDIKNIMAILDNYIITLDNFKINRKYLEYYCYFDKKRNKFILCSDNQRFINHTSNSNLENIISTPDLDIAAIDIKPGDELLCDYNKFDSSLYHYIFQ